VALLFGPGRDMCSIDRNDLEQEENEYGLQNL
jgi:hypothetical protein